MISLAYDLEPSGAIWSPSIPVTFSFDPTKSSAPYTVNFFNTTTNQWEPVATDPAHPPIITIVNGVSTVTVWVPHFTNFSVFGPIATSTSTPTQTSTTKTTTTTPLGFVVKESGLTISPKQVKPGDTVTVGITVENTGDKTGSYTVTFMVNKVVESTKTITLDAGKSMDVTFTTSGNVEGTYLVDVDGISGSFTVTTHPTPTWIVPLVIGVAAVLVVLVVGFFIWRRRTP
jgi:plastocyanin